MNWQVLNQKQHEKAAMNEYNFDHPDAFDFEVLIPTLQRLKKGKKVDVPIYNFITHSREARTVSPSLLENVFCIVRAKKLYCLVLVSKTVCRFLNMD